MAEGRKNDRGRGRGRGGFDGGQYFSFCTIFNS